MTKKKNKTTKLNNKFLFIVLILLVIAAFLYDKIPIRAFTNKFPEISRLPDDVSILFHSNTQQPVAYKIPILLYHYIEYVQDRGDKIRISLNIEPWAFDAQVKTLKDAGYTFLTPSEIPDIISGKIPKPEKPIVLSFDDGYRDFYIDVFPVLQKYNVKAIEYVVNGFLDLPQNLTHGELKEIVDSGLVEIGAHTVDHAYLKGLPADRVKFEVEQSKIGLEKEIGRPVVSFAYPYGAFDLDTVKIVKEAGFTNAVSTVDGDIVTTDNLFSLYRIRPGYNSGPELLSILNRQILSRR